MDSMAVGCDIVEISRIREAAQRHPRFLRRVFSPAEIAECESRPNPWQSFAARFAAKEAVIKALPAGCSPALTEMEVLRDPAGKPQLFFTGAAAGLVEKSGWNGWSVSLSHDRDHAIATVIAWRTKREEAMRCDL
ncbi:holo-(acyl-carrier-protein) synthase [Heliomicrobium modesticaldum Ice1]|uniref:Holo-[acyl-carrier-protein] synthase n=1 Tax=Heliobacterium modesticaldum (strain ATCC 51547 / Ice1) TaxID=498761 RepID=B0TE79_HELMI|nr:holo-(acyl-carrier-protein) synthase [Heliomicrobium modesticaldum Ice1]